MNKFAALLHAKWIAGTKADEINGYWAEDNSRYLVTCPEQLRDDLIELQNVLAEKYQLLCEARQRLQELTREIDRIFE